MRRSENREVHSMWRSSFLYLSTNSGMRRIATHSGIAWRIASRFVAGETVDRAIEVAADLSRRGASAELDYLGENVTDLRQAAAARDNYLELLDRVEAAGLDGDVSLKLTQMGLDVDYRLCRENVETIARRAESLGRVAWLDMEGSAYTDRTIETYLQVRSARASLGIALQGYLFRTKADVNRILSAEGTIRLCKGAYSEPSSVAYPSKKDVDRSFAELSEVLLCSRSFQAIATHDENMIRHVIEFARANGVDRKFFEFQMLYGVRRDLQEKLLADGYRLRVYVPYGGQWYPYFMRRLAERPANLFFLLGSLAREAGDGH
jgi:proline dehydrogenase